MIVHRFTQNLKMCKHKLTGVGIDLLTIISHKVSNVTEDRSGFL